MLLARSSFLTVERNPLGIWIFSSTDYHMPWFYLRCCCLLTFLVILIFSLSFQFPLALCLPILISCSSIHSVVHIPTHISWVHPNSYLRRFCETTHLLTVLFQKIPVPAWCWLQAEDCDTSRKHSSVESRHSFPLRKQEDTLLNNYNLPLYIQQVN